ncbi:YaaC family protein [Melissospora conviva]|uniref:YaaC family protein n=1 Tax=Melissospora conviva TaxID=3388432 RepID=UPI003B7769F2
MYGQTWGELGTTPPVRSWQMLRSLRHEPPGRADKGARKVMFGAALEQAEQLFTAAKSVTPAASPLLLFYGLSQAGRAVAAASSREGNDNRWQLRGHGIANSDATHLSPSDLAMLTVKNHGNGSFTQLADILGAASLPTAVPLGDIWGLLPESAHFPLPEMGHLRPRNLQIARYGIIDDRKLVASIYVPSELLDADQGTHPQDIASNCDQQRAAVRDYLARFPSLNGFDFTTPDGQRIEIRGLAATEKEILIQWEKSPTRSDAEELLRYSVGYRSENLAFPSLGSDTRPPHPFLLWWAVLFTLSKLARYEPSIWAATISVNSSPVAAAIEHILRESMTILPELIHRTIFEAASANSYR